MALLQSSGTIDGIQTEFIDMQLHSMDTHRLQISVQTTFLVLTECCYKLRVSEKPKLVSCVSSQISPIGYLGR